MEIGIIGAGNMGSALGKIWAGQGHTVLFSYARDVQKLAALAASVGPNARAVTPAEAASAEVVFLGVPWAQLEDALAAAGPLTDKVVVTCVSPLRPDFTGETTGIAAPSPISAAERIAQIVPGARVVEAFNTTFAETLAAPSRRFGPDRPTVLYCGEDPTAKAVVRGLIEDCDYDAVDAGPLKAARALETFASAWVQMAVVGSLFPEVALKVLRR